ncbi:TetR/AcrR family transcriptional regulator, partial [Streptomyces sp. ID05-18]|nr:TetR/AcrR family transcriptional regulator [Streptomyces sp. ID05-18]
RQVDEGAFETGLRALLDGLAIQYEQYARPTDGRPSGPSGV